MKVWRWSFVSKCSKKFLDFKNAMKVWENVFGPENNVVGTCGENSSLLSQEYMSAPFNVLEDGPNISDPTKRHDTQPSLFDVNRKLV